MADPPATTPTDPQSAATRQLGAIPFGSLIGGPLTAAVEAQAKAAQSSIGFIQAVAFKAKDVKKPDGDTEVRTISFKYKATDAQGNRSDQELEVPVLTIVPIPYLRIDNMSIQFKANITASTEDTSSKSDVSEKSASLSGSVRYLFFSVKLAGSISSKKDSSSTSTSKYAVEYTMDVNVHAVQDDMPAGMATVLNIMNESIERAQTPAASGK